MVPLGKALLLLMHTLLELGHLHAWYIMFIYNPSYILDTQVIMLYKLVDWVFPSPGFPQIFTVQLLDTIYAM